MNRKYFLHYTWIVTVIMVVYGILCMIDGVSIELPLFSYLVVMIIYVVPMSYISSKEAEVIEIELPRTEGIEKEIENIMINKAKRISMPKEQGVQKYVKSHRYSKWLTNDVVMKADSSKIYLSIPKSYRKYFKNLKI